eukprot:gene393-713_t
MAEKALDALEGLNESLDNVDSSVDILYDKSFESLHEQLSSLESAKLNVSLAYGLASLYYVLLRSKGAPTTEHPIRSDLSRIKTYVDRINQIEKGPEKRKIAVNASAAARMLTHQINSNKLVDAEQAAKSKKIKR